MDKDADLKLPENKLLQIVVNRKLESLGTGTL